MRATFSLPLKGGAECNEAEGRVRWANAQVSQSETNPSVGSWQFFSTKYIVIENLKRETRNLKLPCLLSAIADLGHLLMPPYLPPLRGPPPFKREAKKYG